ADVAHVKQVLRAQRPHQGNLHQIIRYVAVACQRARIAPQRRNGCLHILAKPAQTPAPRIAPRRRDSVAAKNTTRPKPIPFCGRHKVDLSAYPRWKRPLSLCHRRPDRLGTSVMAESSGLLRGKRGLIMGVANNGSIAWGIAKACHGAGAALAFTYQGDALKKRVEPLAHELGGLVTGHCDVTDAATIDATFAVVAREWGALDFVVHAIAFSDKGQLDGRYVDTTPDNFDMTLRVSCYSFTAIAQRAEKLMGNGGALLTLTYYGAEKWMPHYNVMGVPKAALEASGRYLAADLGEKNTRVNAISAGPIKTLAASGIGDFRYILKWNELNSPMRRTVSTEEVGDTAVYLLSDYARGVT